MTRTVSTASTREQDAQGTGSVLAALAEVGRLLHGEEWQRATARDLGRRHPSGPRPGYDSRFLRRWLSGSAPVPRWVASALPYVLADAAAARQREIAAIRDLYDRIVADHGPTG